jgi:hypothetical protein
MTTGTPKMSAIQLTILKHLHMRGHAMYMYQIAKELGKRFIGVGKLRKCGYIRPTDQGWLITDSGKLRAEEGV